MSATLMISVSGMRGHVGTDLTPELVTRHAAALGAWARARESRRWCWGVIHGRAGPMFAHAAMAGLMSVGVDVIDLGIVPTPTVQMAVEEHHAGAGLILTASHNPIEWNALKFVGPDGIFLDGDAGAAVRALAEEGPGAEWLGGTGRGAGRRGGARAAPRRTSSRLPMIDVGRSARAASRWRSTASAVPAAARCRRCWSNLVAKCSGINLETDGHFPRAPEPIPENLGGAGSPGPGRRRPTSGWRSIRTSTGWPWWTTPGTPIGEDYTLAFAVRTVLEWRQAGRPVGG